MPNSSLEVAVTGGTLKGFFENGVWAFRGIPFAAPPIGALRFQPPIPVEPWTGVLECKEFSASPVQPSSPMATGPTSEDCLYLNVWTPVHQEEELPVVVWIYGGGFQGGSASIEEFSGESLVKFGNVVFVSINYRVGFLGFATIEESVEFPSTTNLGVRDVISGLKWIQDNISEFGGNPSNVTVMGHSAGAFIAASLVSSERTEELFCKLILLSGGASRIIPYEVSLDITDSAISTLGGDLAKMLNATPEILFQAQDEILSTDIGKRNSVRPTSLGVVLDSQRDTGVLKKHPMDVISHGLKSNLRLLIGVAEAEIAAFRKWTPNQTFAPTNYEELVNEVSSWNIAPERARSIVDNYTSSAGNQQDLASIRELILTDWIYRLPAARLAVNHAKNNGQGWLLEFRGNEKQRLGHGDELPALFEKLAAKIHIDPLPNLENTLKEAIVSFAKNGNPGWSSYAIDSPKTKILGAQSFIEDNTFDDLLALWEGIERP